MFGFLKGKIDVILSNYQYKKGDIIRGNVTMNIKKDIPAKALTAQLVAMQKTTAYTGEGTQSSYVKIYDFKYPLDGEKIYVHL